MRYITGGEIHCLSTNITYVLLTLKLLEPRAPGWGHHVKTNKGTYQVTCVAYLDVLTTGLVDE
jgi:hypothetical protein